MASQSKIYLEKHYPLISETGSSETSALTASASGVERYLSVDEAATVTITLPAFSGRLASSIAAQTLAPDEIPAGRPSCCAKSLAVLSASSSHQSQ